ncbi:PAS-domain containing protein [Aquincola sp. MAHUQ-54]|uniref:PAS-domain containing protein n=1 Tax=Aquincola agrisoli TaxID=3119538 RepID=A0AAW9QL44_9BURK
MVSHLPLLRVLADMLDSLDVALCAFDEDDRLQVWNRHFLVFFPEHAAHIHVGEPYRENLRRFYEGRLGPEERPQLERYVEEGVARHHAQRRPFSFEHRGQRLQVASLPLPQGGRLRMWRRQEGAEPAATPAGEAVPDALGGTAWFDHIADGVAVAADDGQLLEVNQAFVVIYGLPDRVAARGRQFTEVYRQAWQGSEDAPEFEQGLSVLAERMRFTGAPFEVPLPGGRCSRVIEERRPDGRVFAVHADITALKRQQRQLREAEQRARDSEASLRAKSALLEATLERMDQGVVMVDARGLVEVCNRRAIELLGLPEALMAGKPHFQAVIDYQVHQDEFADAPEEVRRIVAAGGMLDRPNVYDRKRPDGRVIEVCTVPIDGGGMLRTYTDITERRRHEERIRHVAQHDGLTALANREVFLEQLAAALQRSPEPFAVHFIDLDRFKPINDEHGHATGDKVLAEVALRMRAVARDTDMVARIGGDEFAILQRHVQAPDQALGLAHRLAEQIAAPMEIDGVKLDVGASIGIAVHPEAGLDADTLLRHADAAMYAAKGRGQAVLLFDGSLPPRGRKA